MTLFISMLISILFVLSGVFVVYGQFSYRRLIKAGKAPSVSRVSIKAMKNAIENAQSAEDAQEITLIKNRYVAGRILYACLFLIVALIATGVIPFGYRPHELTPAELSAEKARVLHDRVLRSDKIPKTYIHRLTFASGEVYQPFYIDFNKLVLPQDSIVKGAGGLRYVVYLKSDPTDSVVFVGSKSGYRISENPIIRDRQ